MVPADLLAEKGTMSQPPAHDFCLESPANDPIRSASQEVAETDSRSGPDNWESYSLEILTALHDP